MGIQKVNSTPIYPLHCEVLFISFKLRYSGTAHFQGRAYTLQLDDFYKCVFPSSHSQIKGLEFRKEAVLTTTFCVQVSYLIPE